LNDAGHLEKEDSMDLDSSDDEGENDVSKKSHNESSSKISSSSKILSNTASDESSFETEVAQQLKSAPLVFCCGNVVNVKSRTQPGENKPGGVARIVKENKATNTYDVKYVLGGKTEKCVDPSFISLREPDGESGKKRSRKRRNTSSEVEDESKQTQKKKKQPTKPTNNDERTALVIGVRL